MYYYIVINIFFIYRDVAQFGSAPVLGTGGRRFESCHLDFISYIHINGYICIYPHEYKIS